jgi:hypothetical protein
MQEEWQSLETMGFPGYILSNKGEVRNEKNGHVLKLSSNQFGVVRVGLMKRDENRQITLSLTRLVARMYVPGKGPTFNTPINLNGDRTDNRAENLMWRPRWFAVKYFAQFKSKPLLDVEVCDIETQCEYANSREAAVTNGLLEEDVMKSVVNGDPCFPTWQRFACV